MNAIIYIKYQQLKRIHIFYNYSYNKFVEKNNYIILTRNTSNSTIEKFLSSVKLRLSP